MKFIWRCTCYSVAFWIHMGIMALNPNKNMMNIHISHKLVSEHKTESFNLHMIFKRNFIQYKKIMPNNNKAFSCIVFFPSIPTMTSQHDMNAWLCCWGFFFIMWCTARINESYIIDLASECNRNICTECMQNHLRVNLAYIIRCCVMCYTLVSGTYSYSIARW